MRCARFAAVAIVVTLVGATATGCGVGTEVSPTMIADEPAQPFVLTGGVDDGDPEEATAVSLYLVREDRLVHVTRDLRAGAGLTETVASLLAGPTDSEARAGLATAIPSSTALGGVDIDGTTATVDLTNDFTAIGGIEEILAVGQIVLTLTGFDGVDDVVIGLEGRVTAVPTGSGALTERPVSAQDYAELLGS